MMPSVRYLLARLRPPLLGALALALCVGGCNEEPSPPERVDQPPPVLDRDSWWNGATQRASGQERILAPRELRGLLEEGRRRGFDADAEWWQRRSAWAYERILSVDPDDVAANHGVGRRTLQSIEGFAPLWQRMLDTRVPTDTITELLEQYGGDVLDGRPVFLYEKEYEVVRARLRAAADHLDRMEQDASYAALQHALRHVHTSHHGDYPFLHEQVGPFLVFYAARDLQEIDDEDAEAEERRLAGRRAYYRLRLKEWTSVYAELLADVARLYPEVWKKYAPGPRTIFHQWIFSERAWYVDFLQRLHKEDAGTPYRHGFFHAATGWAYLVEPPEPEAGPDGAPPPPGGDSSRGLRETAAYLAAAQLLHRWARDAEDPTLNHLERSEAYWFKEGWPSFLAARRVEKPAVGPALKSARERNWTLPPLQRVVERRSRIERLAFILPPAEDFDNRPPPDGGFTDLAWLLVRHLNEEPRRPAFERFLLSQIEGTRRGFDWFEECFGVRGTDAWERFERAVYRRIE